MSQFTLPESLPAGSRVAVQCVVVHGDPPVTLAWLHDGAPALATPGVTVTPLGQYVLALVIERLRQEHSGNYTCKASSPAATSSHSATLRVHGKSSLPSCTDGNSSFQCRPPSSPLTSGRSCLACERR